MDALATFVGEAALISYNYSMPKQPTYLSMFILFICSLSAFAHAEDKVAVLVSAGDVGALEESMQSIEKQAVQTYEQLGYKVVIVGGVSKRGLPLTPESLDSTLSGLKGVKDLRLDFIGHGGLQPLPASVKYDGNEVAITSARRASGDSMLDPKQPGKVVWLAANESTADHGRNYYGHKAELLGFKPGSNPALSHRKIEQALDHFRAANPDANTTVNLLNCFSGAMAVWRKGL